MPHQFKNPPIVEALCEISFSSEPVWDITVAGLFYEKIKGEFPKKEQVRKASVEISPMPDGNLQPKITVENRVQFSADDKPFIIQVGSNRIAINVLGSYPGWKDFKEQIVNTVEICKSVTNAMNIEAIALRYINKFFLPTANDVEHYLSYRPVYPLKDMERVSGFNCGTQVKAADGSGVVNVILATAVNEGGHPKEGGTYDVVLDLAYIRNELAGVAKVDDFIESAHTEIEALFLSSVTEKSLEMFS